MAEQRTEEIEQVSSDGRTVRKVQNVEDSTLDRGRNSNIASRIVWYIAGVILALLAFRFILALLGANRDNGFADLIFSASYPFVAPFFTLFSYDLDYGVSRVEVFTLVAMAVYTAVAYAISKLVSIGK